ncbi:MAG: tetratricopeptide repeat protein, partial [Alphaproteobacteria bacterium]|nr:tetratricopeptide repeat protein [Alphaproteobacteria bacterium]
MNRAAWAVLALAALAACQSDKPATAPLSAGAPDVPATAIPAPAIPATDAPPTRPPRSIADIEALLDAGAGADTRAIAAARAVADSAVPAGADVPERARFLRDRGFAARQIGRTLQYVADVSSAAALLADDKLPMQRFARGPYFFAASRAHEEYGDFGEAIRLMRRARDMADGWCTDLGSAAAACAMDGVYAALLGRLDEAETSVRKARVETQRQRDFERAGASRVAGKWHPGRDLFVDLAEGMLAEIRGRTDAALERYAQCKRTAQEARRIGWSAMPTGWENVAFLGEQRCEIARADLLARTGRLAEAEGGARTTLRSLAERFGAQSPPVIEALNTLARVLVAQGRIDEAARLDERAVAIGTRLQLAGKSLPLVRSRIGLAQAAIARRDWPAAERQIRQAEADLAGAGELIDALVRADLGWALSRAQSGAGAEAIPVLRRQIEAYGRTLGADAPAVLLRRGALAAALAQGGDRTAALAEFRAVARHLLAMTGTRGIEDEYRRVILESYLAAIARDAGGAPPQDSVAEAFAVAEALRGGGSVQAALARAAARAAASGADAMLAELARRDLDLQTQVEAISAFLGSALAAARADPQAMAPLRERLQGLVAEQARVRAEIGRSFPAYGALLDPKPAALETVRRALKPGEALVAFLVGRDATYAWSVPAAGTIGFQRAPLGAQALDALAARLRAGVTLAGATVGDVRPFDLAAAEEIHRRLLEPLA